MRSALYRALHYKPRKRGTADATTAEIACSAQTVLGDRRITLAILHEDGSRSALEMCSEEAKLLALSINRLAEPR